MQDNEKILALLKQEVFPALGCTEPAAVALAVAHAAQALPARPQTAEVYVSPNIYKNGMGVGIPNTGLVGLTIAAALGMVIRNPEKELEVLADLSPAQIAEAKALAASSAVKIAFTAVEDKVYIECILFDGLNRSRAIIKGRHSWLEHLELNGVTILHQEIGAKGSPKLIDCNSFKLRDYYDFASKVDVTLLEQFDMGEGLNLKIAEYGLHNASGISVGKMLKEQIEAGILGDDIHHHAMVLTAAATDARMSGCNLPVIANTGSGNQGLSVTLPIIAVAQKLNRPRESMLRALAMGHLVSIHIKNKVGLLSCLCGCLSAAAGAASGIVMLLDGDFLKIEYAIKNMIGNTAGMVCDGAKEGCSLKVATNTSAAVQAAILANMDRCISSNDGIIAADLDETIENLAEFVSTGMQNADPTILSIMINKNNNKEANHV